MLPHTNDDYIDDGDDYDDDDDDVDRLLECGSGATRSISRRWLRVADPPSGATPLLCLPKLHCTAASVLECIRLLTQRQR